MTSVQRSSAQSTAAGGNALLVAFLPDIHHVGSQLVQQARHPWQFAKRGKGRCPVCTRWYMKRKTSLICEGNPEQQAGVCIDLWKDPILYLLVDRGDRQS